jgi:hypothetical protein
MNRLEEFISDMEDLKKKRKKLLEKEKMLEKKYEDYFMGFVETDSYVQLVGPEKKFFDEFDKKETHCIPLMNEKKTLKVEINPDIFFLIPEEDYIKWERR